MGMKVAPKLPNWSCRRRRRWSAANGDGLLVLGQTLSWCRIEPTRWRCWRFAVPTTEATPETEYDAAAIARP